MKKTLINETLSEMMIVESGIQVMISELRAKGYSDEEIFEILDGNEGMSKMDELIDRIIENLD